MLDIFITGVHNIDLKKDSTGSLDVNFRHTFGDVTRLTIDKNTLEMLKEKIKEGDI